MDRVQMWVTVAVALLGLASTVLAVFITQRASNQRDEASRAHELERERARWEREDKVRTFEQRRDVYVDFYVALRRLRERLRHIPVGGAMQEDWREEVWQQFPRVALYGSNTIADLGDHALDLIVTSTVHRCRDDEDSHRLERLASETFRKLLEAMREELGVPKGRALGPFDLVGLPGIPSNKNPK